MSPGVQIPKGKIEKVEGERHEKTRVFIDSRLADYLHN